jgi:hypothetical protein
MIMCCVMGSRVRAVLLLSSLRSSCVWTPVVTVQLLPTQLLVLQVAPHAHEESILRKRRGSQEDSSPLSFCEVCALLLRAIARCHTKFDSWDHNCSYLQHVMNGNGPDTSSLEQKHVARERMLTT